VKDDIVLVSNRGPVSFVESDGRFQTKRGAGGLAGALDPVARRLGEHALWICAANSEVDRRALQGGAAERLQDELGYPVHLLDIEPDTYDLYYNVVSNRMLWFANHCLWDELGIKDFGDPEISAWNSAYEPVNEKFARTVADLAPPNALVLFQDYHLARAPGHLRALQDEHTIGHFTHSSFCGPEGLERLPAPLPHLVIDGMLCANLVGFHVAPWAEAFYACCERAGGTVDRARGIVRHKGRQAWVRTYPIPIDARELRERAAGEAARRWADRLRESSDLLLVRADRAEPSKNIVRGFRAFELLLERRADLRSRVRFVACLYPSRQSVAEYQHYAGEIERTVTEINRRFPDSIELFLWDDYDRTLGALQVYDALLVNSIMDGMNLVSKEGPAINARDGALVLSRWAGSHEELGRFAVTIDDPYDVDETARAIEQALELDRDERSTRAAVLRDIVESQQPEDWIERQFDDLSEIAEGRVPLTSAPR
jgi:trehalose 6-phosphate synthase